MSAAAVLEGVLLACCIPLSYGCWTHPDEISVATTSGIVGMFAILLAQDLLTP